MSIKPYPCCHFAHGAVDCALGLFADGISAARVSAIQAIIDEVAAGFVCKPIRSKQAPGNAYGAKFSLPYLIARALVDGRVDQDAFTEPSIRRADLLAVARKVSYAEAARGATGFPKYFPGHLIVTLTDGQVTDMPCTWFIQISGAWPRATSPSLSINSAALNGTTGPVEIFKPNAPNVAGQRPTTSSTASSAAEVGRRRTLSTLLKSSACLNGIDFRPRRYRRHRRWR